VKPKGAAVAKKNSPAWVHRGFEEFARGRFDNGGSNLYVNARGEIETIHRTDVNDDGCVDIVLANTHGYIERGPTWIYKAADGEGKDWERRELGNDSGWMSRIADVDGDGFADLVVVNAENGVTSELDSYVYWGGPNGLTGERTELPTSGAYDVAVADVNGDGRMDLVFPSAWVDHHNPGRPRLLTVYVQTAPRQFEDHSEQYGLSGIAASSVACGDLTGNGKLDLVVANYRSDFEYDTDSFVYWGTEDGFDAENPLHLPTHYALRVVLADLDNDGRNEIIFCGGDQVQIYWNDAGKFSPDKRTILEVAGLATMFCVGAVYATVADVDGDGSNELILAMIDGVEIRSTRDLQTVQTFLPMPYATWVSAVDLNGDGRPELIVSKYDDRVNYETDSTIFWNGPDGFSSDRVALLPTAGAIGNSAGDLDGDGKPVVIFNSTLQGPSQYDKNFPVYVYLGGKEADYGVHRRLDLPSGSDTYSYALADLDLDGYGDLVVTNVQGLRIFPGGPDGPQADRYIDLVTGRKPIMQLNVADLNRDGYLDLLMSVLTYDDKPETMARSSLIFYGSAAGFSVERSQELPTYSNGMAILADVDKDGYLDIVTDDKRGEIVIFLGGPDGYSRDRVSTIPLDASIMVGSINVADLNNNGWLDLIVCVQSHYARRDDSFHIFHGGPEGYSPARCTHYAGGFSPGSIAVADYNNDGHLDLAVASYSSGVTRELPLHIFWGDGETIDLDHPLELPAESSFAFLPVDLSGNGYQDLVVGCHRNDLGHQVDSLIYWNGPEGFAPQRRTALPGMGPHWMTTHDPGNAYTREPCENYFSPPFHLGGYKPARLHWDARVPETTAIKFQLRWAPSEQELDDAPWQGPGGEETHFETSGQQVAAFAPTAQWLQYRAIFYSLNGCRSPQLREVRVELTD
jgi:hypothetical protein